MEEQSGVFGPSYILIQQQVQYELQLQQLKQKQQYREQQQKQAEQQQQQQHIEQNQLIEKQMKEQEIQQQMLIERQFEYQRQRQLEYQRQQQQQQVQQNVSNGVDQDVAVVLEKSLQQPTRPTEKSPSTPPPQPQTKVGVVSAAAVTARVIKQKKSAESTAAAASTVETPNVTKPTAAQVLSKEVSSKSKKSSGTTTTAAAATTSATEKISATAKTSAAAESSNSSCSDESVTSCKKNIKSNIFNCITSRFSTRAVFIEVYIIASCVFQLAASAKSRTLELVGMPFNNIKSMNVTYDDIKGHVPENSKKTFNHFKNIYGGLTSKINSKALIEFIIDTMTATPVLVSSNFVSLYSLRKNKILNSIISFENLGKICALEDCKKIASVVIYDKIRTSKTIYCMSHSKKIAAMSDIFVDENNDLFSIKLYHPYLVSITCDMDYLLGSVYKIESSIYQHDLKMNEYETEKMKKKNMDDTWEPIFRLDIERNNSYLMGGQKVHCINGIRRYVNDCSHSELNTNAHTFGSIATVMGTKCVLHSLRDSDYYFV